jgi:transcription antitermination factor NusG
MNAQMKLDQHPGFRELITFGNGLNFREPRVWRALTARPSKEQKAADWLKLRSLHAYWPNYSKEIRAAGLANGTHRRRTVFCSIIPGYLFMATRDEANEPSLQALVEQVPGLIGFVRDGSGNAASLTNDDIEIIRRIESNENLPPAKSHVHRFKTGDDVRFADDLLGRWPNGKIAELAADGRIVIEVALLGRMVPVRALPFQIEAM